MTQEAKRILTKSLFRDQNFGLNDLAAVQDVRNDFTQQDIDESTVIKDKGMEDRHRNSL